MKYIKRTNHIKTKTLTIFLISLSFILGFLYRNSNPIYLVYFKNKLENKLQKIFNTKNINNSSNVNCPRKILNLPNNSTLIIGHAYGSSKKSDLRGNIGIAPKVYNFYQRNKQNIDSIIFSGDVLKEPSLKKWQDFYSKFDENVKIYIAPGNHDIGGKYFDSALRDVFKIFPHKNQKGFKFPFEFIKDESLFIIGDSNSKYSSLNKIISIIDKEKVLSNVYVVIHHAFPNGLRDAVNASGRHDFVEDSFFANKFKETDNKKIFFLYGDGGAFKIKPRFKCLSLGNSYHVISGIGEIEGDTILVISDNKLYRMEI